MKKVISLLLSILLLLPMALCSYASEIVSYGLYLCGIEVTSVNASNILGSGLAEYDPSANELIIYDINYVGSGYEYTSLTSLDSNAAIYSTHDLNIVIDGGNTFTLQGASYSTMGIFVDGNLSIEASKGSYCKLNVGSASNASYGVFATGSVTLNNLDLAVSSNETTASNSISTAIYCTKALNIDSSTINATAGISPYRSYGINASGTNITSSTINATSSSSNNMSMGIRCGGSYAQTNSAVVATSPNTTGTSYGLHIANTGSTVTVDGGSLNATAGSSTNSISAGIRMSSATGTASFTGCDITVSGFNFGLDIEKTISVGCNTNITAYGSQRSISTTYYTYPAFSAGNIKIGASQDTLYSVANRDTNELDEPYLTLTNPHKEGTSIVENRVEPTYDEDGSYDTVVYCTVCGDELSRVNSTIPKLIPLEKASAEGSLCAIKLTNVSDINYIRYTSGYYTTSADIRASENLVQLNETYIASNKCDNTLLLPVNKSGGYSVWVRYTDGSSEIFNIVVDHCDQYVDVDELTVTIGDIIDLKDCYIAKGTYSNYRECKNAPYYVGISATKVGKSNTYSYLVREPGDYTICIRYTDATIPNLILHTSCEVIEPDISVLGLTCTVSNLDNIKCIRTAPGEYSTSGEIKRATGARTFTAQNVIKGADTYTIHYSTEGTYSISVEYNNGYTVVNTIEIEYIKPTISYTLDSITLGNVGSNLYIIRYAPGEITTASQIKRTTGNRYIKPQNIVGDSTTVSNLYGTYSFLVQYIDGSQNIFTHIFE